MTVPQMAAISMRLLGAALLAPEPSVGATTAVLLFWVTGAGVLQRRPVQVLGQEHAASPSVVFTLHVPGAGCRGGGMLVAGVVGEGAGRAAGKGKVAVLIR